MTHGSSQSDWRATLADIGLIFIYNRSAQLSARPRHPVSKVSTFEQKGSVMKLERLFCVVLLATIAVALQRRKKHDSDYALRATRCRTRPLWLRRLGR